MASVDRGRYGLGIEPRKNSVWSADGVGQSGRHHWTHRHRKRCSGSTWSQTPCTYRSFLRGTREVPLLALASCQGPRGQKESTTMMNDGGKSDWLIVPEKLPNKGCGWPQLAEEVEESGQAKGNLERQTRVWTQIQIARRHLSNRCAQRASGHPETRQAFVPEAGAQCDNSARWDLCGGRPVRAVPTATRIHALAGSDAIAALH